MNILVVGMGTIGEPLAKLFLEAQKNLGIGEVIVHKNSPHEDCRGMLDRFSRAGAKIAVYEEKKDAFEKLLAPVECAPHYAFEEALDRANVIIDCTEEKIGRMLKEKYYIPRMNRENLFGCIGQGSEKEFGKPYAFGINDDALVPGKDKFIWVVSCNAHQILRITKALVLNHGNGPDDLIDADFTLTRRAGDISQNKSTAGMEIGKAGHAPYGSHQGEDAAQVLETLGISPNLHTTADKANNPFMHVSRFTITLRRNITLDAVMKRLQNDPLVALTHKLTNNAAFAVGRDWGHCGRILNQTIVVVPSLEVKKNKIYGACFTPQDGNALLSSVAATLWLRNPKTYLQEMREHILKPPFLFTTEI